MKLKLIVIVAGVLILTSCKKDHECECTTVFYDSEGYYAGKAENKYTVKNQSECDSHNKNTASEVTNCHLDDH